MDVQADAVAAVRHPKDAQDGDGGLRAARHPGEGGTWGGERMRPLPIFIRAPYGAETPLYGAESLLWG